MDTEGTLTASVMLHERIPDIQWQARRVDRLRTRRHIPPVDTHRHRADRVPTARATRTASACCGARGRVERAGGLVVDSTICYDIPRLPSKLLYAAGSGCRLIENKDVSEKERKRDDGRRGDEY